jgi:uncharacterized YigZ family protein
MEDPDFYRTPKTEGRSEIRIKGSRFLGFAGLVSDEREAESVIRRLAKIHHDASHVCWAYRFGPEPSVTARFSDAGEPSGTAGKPILDAVVGRHLFGTVCVVVRYFGGTKLGTGGLARAYAECSAAALDAAGIAERVISRDFRVSFDYDSTGAVMALVSVMGGEVIHSNYGEGADFIVRVRRSLAGSFVRRITDATGGKARCGLLSEEKT